MSDCVHIRFGRTNVVPDATLSSNRTSLTPLDYLKNQWPARRAAFNTPADDGILRIEGAWTAPQVIDYLALPTHELPPTAQLRLTLYSDAAKTDEIYSPDYTQVADYPALGSWQAGIDPYGLPRVQDLPSVWTHWTDKTHSAMAFRLDIVYNASVLGTLGDWVSLRMLVMGRKLELQKNFAYDHVLQNVGDPELVKTSSGSFIEKRFQPSGRRWSFDLPRASVIDRTELFAFEEEQGGQPFIFSAFPGKSGFLYNQYSFLGRFSKALRYRQKHNHLHSISPEIVEA